MLKDATISPCGRYRYLLSRCWAAPGDDNADRYAAFIMLNPSTADATNDDPTIRRCIAYAKAWGMGGLMVANLFAYRSTSPANLLREADPIGPDNDRYIKEACSMSAVEVAAWGNHGIYQGRGAIVRRMLPDLKVLRLTSIGQPAHPLYLPKDLTPMEWKDG